MGHQEETQVSRVYTFADDLHGHAFNFGRVLGRIIVAPVLVLIGFGAGLVFWTK